MPNEINNSFVTMLVELRSGRAINELSDRLAELVGKVKETGKPGELLFKLKVAPASVGDTGQVFVTDRTVAHLPETVRPSTLFFPNESNVLLRRDPNQRELELREVTKPEPQELKEVANAG